MGASLVTLAEYKSYMGYNTPNEDTRISAVIPKASDLVKSYCRRSFIDYVSTDKVEYHNGGGALIIPEETPIISIASLLVSTDYGVTYTSDFTDWVLLKREQVIVRPTGVDFVYTPNGYKLTYKTGYATLPEDLKVAVMDLITYYLKNDMAVHSNKAPGTNSVQIEYVTSSALPAHIKRVLDLYAEHYA